MPTTVLTYVNANNCTNKYKHELIQGPAGHALKSNQTTRLQCTPASYAPPPCLLKPSTKNIIQKYSKLNHFSFRPPISSSSGGNTLLSS